MKKTIIIAIAALLLICLFLPTNITCLSENSQPKNTQRSTGNITVINTSTEADSDVYVTDNDTLIIENCTYTISWNHQHLNAKFYNIYIKDNGTLILRNMTLEGKDSKIYVSQQGAITTTKSKLNTDNIEVKHQGTIIITNSTLNMDTYHYDGFSLLDNSTATINTATLKGDSTIKTTQQAELSIINSKIEIRSINLDHNSTLYTTNSIINLTSTISLISDALFTATNTVFNIYSITAFGNPTIQTNNVTMKTTQYGSFHLEVYSNSNLTFKGATTFEGNPTYYIHGPNTVFYYTEDNGYLIRTYHIILQTDTNQPITGALLTATDVQGTKTALTNNDGRGEITLVFTDVRNENPGLNRPGDTTITVSKDDWTQNIVVNPVTSAPVIIIRDITAPDIIITNLTVENNTATITWISQATDISHYEVRLDKGDWINVGTVNSYIFTDIGNGSHTFYVKAVDNTGHETIVSETIGGTDNANIFIIIFLTLIIIIIVVIIVIVYGVKKKRRKEVY